MQVTARKKFLGITIALAMSATMGACGAGSTESAGGTTGVDAQKKTITIGFDSITSGPQSAFGVSGDGARVFFDAANEAGGVEGYTYKFIEKDSAFQAAQSASVMRSLASEALAVLTTSTPVFMGAEPVAARLGVPVVAAADGSLFSPGKKGMYSINPVYTRLQSAALDFLAKKFPGAKVAMPYSDNTIGKTLAENLPEYAKTVGLDMSTLVPVAVDALDFAPYAARLLKSKPQVILTAFLGPAQTASLMKAVSAAGASPKWMISFDAMTPEFVAAAGKYADGAYTNNYLLYPTEDTEQIRAYDEAMKKHAPEHRDSQFAQQGWTQAALVDTAIRKVLGDNKKLTRKSFIAAFESLDVGPVGFLSKATISSTKRYFPDQAAVYQVDLADPASPFKRMTDYEDMPLLTNGS